MFGRFRFSAPLALVCSVAVTSLSGTAWGQVVSQGTPPVEREPLHTTTSTDSTVALTLTRGDCVDSDDITYTFNIGVTGYATKYNLEIWAGEAACNEQVFWQPGTRTCWKLDELTVKNGIATGVYHPKQLFGINMGGGTPILNSCDDQDVSKSRQTLNVYAILTDSGKVVGTPTSFTVYYDLGGPAAPEIDRVKIAENALQVLWNSVEGEDEGEIIYKFYCAKDTDYTEGCASAALVNSTTGGSGGGGEGGASTSSGGQGGVGGGQGGTTASTGGDGGTAGTTAGGNSATGGSSASSTSAKPVIAKGFEMFPCGSVRGFASNSGYTDPILENNVPYAVAVTAVDQYGNESEFSELRCNTPEQVDTFFERYRDEGGKAGGGFCSLRHVPQSLAPVGLLLLSLGAIAGVRRRKAARLS